MTDENDFFRESQAKNAEIEKRLLQEAKRKIEIDDAPIWRVINRTHKGKQYAISYYDENARPYFYREIFDVSGLEGFETANFQKGKKSIPYIYPIINGEKRTEYKNELVKRRFVINDEERANCKFCFNLVRTRRGEDWIGREACVCCFSSYRVGRECAIKPVKV
jgi:hypothetical protein